MDHLLKLTATETLSASRFFKQSQDQRLNNKTALFGYMYGRQAGKSLMGMEMMRSALEDTEGFVVVPYELDSEALTERYSTYLKSLLCVEEEKLGPVLDSYSAFFEKEIEVNNQIEDHVQHGLKLEASSPYEVAAEGECKNIAAYPEVSISLLDGIHLTLNAGQVLHINGIKYVFDGVKAIPEGHMVRSSVQHIAVYPEVQRTDTIPLIVGDVVTSGYVRVTDTTSCGLGVGLGVTSDPMPMISAGTPTISAEEACRALGLGSHSHTGTVSGRISSGLPGFVGASEAFDIYTTGRSLFEGSQGIVNGSTKPGYQPFDGRSLLDSVGRSETNACPTIPLPKLLAGAGISVSDLGDGTSMIEAVPQLTSVNGYTGDVYLTYNDLLDRPEGLVTEETLNSRLDEKMSQILSIVECMMQTGK